MQCTAKAKSTGQQCQRRAMANGKCYVHGGPTPRGRALPQPTHGRYSKDLPTRLAARYEEARSDPDLLNLNAEIHLTYAMLTEALRGMDQGEAGRLWRDLKTTWDALQEANRQRDGDAAKQALSEIGRLIARGVADAAARSEVLDIVERRRKLVESEAKRRTAMQQMITAERLMVLVSAVTDVVMRHVDDPRQRAAIAADIGAIISRGDPDED